MRVPAIVLLAISVILSYSVSAQKKATSSSTVENSPDAVFKAFATAFFNQDLKRMKSLSIYSQNIEVLVKVPKFEEERRKKLIEDLKVMPIKWYQKDEKVKIHGGHITVNDLMSNDNKRIGTIRMLDFVYPLQLTKMRSGQWVADPAFMIRSVRKHLEAESKRKRKNFRVELDGQLFYLNADEMVKFTGKDKQEHELKLFKNDIQHYKDGRLSFQYHKEMDVYPGPSKNGFVYTLNSSIGPEVHVLLYNPGAKLADEQKKFIDLWIENYEVKDARFEEKRLKDVRQNINGKECDGKVMYVILNGKVIYNQFNFLEIDGRVVGVFGKSKSSDAGLLNQYLAIVCENIKVSKSRVKK